MALRIPTLLIGIVLLPACAGAFAPPNPHEDSDADTSRTPVQAWTRAIPRTIAQGDGHASVDAPLATRQVPFVAGSDPAEWDETTEADPGSSSTRYACPQDDAQGDARYRVHEPVAELVAAAHPKKPHATSMSSLPSSLEGNVDPQLALQRAATLDPATLSLFERIVAQNAALTLAFSSPEEPSPIGQLAEHVVRHLALPNVVLEQMGDHLDDGAVSRWLGPEEHWVDRKGVACGDGRLLLHDRIAGGTRAFRPVRVGGRRALIAQLIAVDDRGAPHVTSVVGGMEIFRGTSTTAPACVVELDPQALRAGAPGGLKAAPLDRLAKTVFVRPDPPDRIGCMGCHQPGGIGFFDDVPATEAFALRSTRRTAVLDFVGRRLAERGTEHAPGAPPNTD